MPALPAWNTIEWARPLALWGLVLPALLLVLSWRGRRPELRAVGTLAIWRGLGQSLRPTGRRRRWRMPLERAFAILALVAGVLGLAEPRPAGVALPRPWRILVDRSPSMYLPVDGASGETRLERALEDALAWLTTQDGGAGRVWIDASSAPHVECEARELPEVWRRAPWPPLAEADWGGDDRERTLWISDHAPAPAPSRAALYCSGGEAVPGAIGSAGQRLLLWDGEHVLTGAESVAPARVVLAGELAAPLRSIVGAWAEARGLTSEGAGPCVLRVEGLEGARGAETRAARDGWSAVLETRAGGLVLAPQETVWLRAERAERWPLVAWSAGSLRLAIGACAEPQGDPALFAVSWCDLLDGAVAPRPEVVAFSERQGAGGRIAHPREGAAPAREPAAPVPLAAWLATVAAASALLGGLIALTRS